MKHRNIASIGAWVVRGRAGRRAWGMAWALATALALVWGVPAHAQLGGSMPTPAELVKVTAEPVTIEHGQNGVAKVHLVITSGWHINANPPSPDYMIPSVLELGSAGGVVPGDPVYPPPHMVKLSFDDSELWVYDGTADIVLPVAVSETAAGGAHVLEGKLRFQACNDQVCLPPNSVPVTLTVIVKGGSGAGAAPGAGATGGTAAAAPEAAGETPAGGSAGAPGAGLQPGATPAPSPGFSTGPGQGGAAAGVDNPIARALEKGSFATFLTLFLIGLALNLTPCVYPMLGVTVSIFGGRGAAPPLQAFGMAVVYVMGIALMYSVLGLVAAFSGGLFGSALQSPIVLIVIGLLLVALSLSMFGLYEIQLPPALMMKLGGQTATGAMGVFASGLLVGVFAAPCIGPPIVALLAIVGAKGDPVFGFTSFFTLSMGLGAPYLVLGTFSNLLARLPRSGEWMVWVKKVFGIVLLAIGVFYAMLAIAPKLAFWVAPITLLIGGVYLGFFERSKGRSPAFVWIKRAMGLAAILGGAFLFSAIISASSIEFREYQEQHLQAALEKGRPVLMDFSADWCVPCHELETLTFTDQNVIAASHEFEVFKVDLTRYDSPESERLRQTYDITGVPTVVFLTPGGHEVRAARVEGYLRPDLFIERMKTARAASRGTALAPASATPGGGP